MQKMLAAGAAALLLLGGSAKALAANIQ